MESKCNLKPGTSLFGYRVIEFVGEGGWACVYKAQHPELPMCVAIKQLKPEWAKDEHALQRFFREAEIVARINHPNVVRIFDLKHDGKAGSHYIITEFAEKGTLGNQLEKSPAGLPIDEVLSIAMDICGGLEAAHQKGIVHRDIKPSNILLFDVGGRDMCKLADFGIARVLAPEGVAVTPPPGPVGTFYYMSPEQLDTETAIDHRSDLYSLGVLLYELLTGQVPFTGKVQDICLAHMYVAPTPPMESRADVPEALELITLQALRKDPEDRYQSAADMNEALSAIVDVSVRREREVKFETLLEPGLKHLEQGDLETALEKLRQAAILEPGNQRVLEALQKARVQRGLERSYELGVQYLGAGDWEDARDTLAQVLAHDPDYAGGRAKEQLDQATQALAHERRRRDLMVGYRRGMGHFRRWRWSQAIAQLEKVAAEDPEFEDAADRLAEAQEYIRADQLLQQAQRHEELEEWEDAVDLLEEVRLLRAPHIDVTEELEIVRTRWAESRGQIRLAGWYDEGLAQLETGNLEQAREDFERIYKRRPSYRDVEDRLRQVEKEIKLKQLFERASTYETACNWDEAIEVYWEILAIDRDNRKATRRLARAQNCSGRGRLVSTSARARNWWDEQGRRTKTALMALCGLIALVLCGGVIKPLAPSLVFGELTTPTATPTPIPTSSSIAVAATPTTTLTPMPTDSPTSTPGPKSTSTETASPTPMLTGTPMPTPTATPTPTPTTTPTPTPRVIANTPMPLAYPTPVVEFGGIIACNVTFRWQWPRTLAEDEWFAVRVWREGIDERRSVIWTKEREYTHTLRDGAEYTWEVVICQGDPAAGHCSGDEQLAVSEEDAFSFGGCRPKKPTPTS